MTQQVINTGTLPNDGTGDTLLSAMNKINSNFTDLYSTSYSANVVNAFNTRTGNITLTALDVTNALTYTPLNKAGDTATGLMVFGNGLVSNNNASVNVNVTALGSLPAAVTGSVLRLINSDTNSTFITVDSYVNAGNPESSIILRGARGTGAAPTAIQNNDIIGSVGGLGFGSSIYQSTPGGQINFVSEGVFNNASTPTAISFQVTPSSGNTAAEKMRLTSAGVLSVSSGVASTTNSTGSIVITGSGGLGIGGAVNIGGTLSMTSTSPIMVMNSTSGTTLGTVDFAASGSNVFQIQATTSSFAVARYSGGSFVDSPIIVNSSNGLVTMGDGATFGALTTVAYSGPGLVVNDTSGSGQSSIFLQSSASNVWSIKNQSGSAGTFAINRYVAGVFTDAPITISNSTGLVTMVDGAAITGGAINNATIGATTASTGRFTTLTATSTLTGFPGRLLNIQVITSTGTYTPTTGTNSIIVEAVGGGGAGGGAVTTTAGNTSVGGGGGSGAYAKVYISGSITSQSVTIGAGGTGVSGGTGNTGSATSFGSFVSCPAGVGASATASVSSASLIGGGAAGATPTISGVTTTILSQSGNLGSYGMIQNGTSSVSGGGAPTLLGAGGNYASATSAGAPGIGYGSGGGGSSALNGGTATTGGAGKAGVVIIYEYA